MIYNLIVVLAVLAACSANIHDRAFYEEKFFEWIQEHKVDATSGSHFVKMLQNFADNHDLIETHNAGTSSYKLGHNKFSHMGRAEWKEFVGKGLIRPTESEGPKFIHQAPANPSTIPASVDWRSTAVTGVKDQGQCGSCWSFSTTGALEGAYAIKYGTVNSYSEQNFVDCDTFKNGGKDMGCNGGLMDNAFTWAKKNGGVCSEAAYPYVSGTTQKAGTCAQSSCAIDAKIAPASYTDVAKSSDTAMMSALAQQPVSIAIEADQAAFQLYKSGVFTGACGTSLDHGVLAVGYGTESGGDFYLVKNSWGTTWGDAGYIKLGRGSQYNKGAGQCGMLTGPPSYPNLA